MRYCVRPLVAALGQSQYAGTMSERHNEPGPSPEESPGLDGGNSVRPGDTPPDAGTGDDQSHGAPPAKSPSSAKPLIIIGSIGVAVLLLIFIGYIAGIIS